MCCNGHRKKKNTDIPDSWIPITLKGNLRVTHFKPGKEAKKDIKEKADENIINKKIKKSLLTSDFEVSTNSSFFCENDNVYGRPGSSYRIIRKSSKV
ncbi:134_t:CDS:2 [Dentiscutata heterogama]|uniref:134_t:CDS:1 n=1 Tax=Dentiscutata heterogama TaxID=1316150 RepID=A0ACA9K0N5_9GLOM|nr:134_t:CDS:2 [Dentiscutata heterogama]